MTGHRANWHRASKQMVWASSDLANDLASGLGMVGDGHAVDVGRLGKQLSVLANTKFFGCQPSGVCVSGRAAIWLASLVPCSSILGSGASGRTSCEGTANWEPSEQ